MEGGEGGNRLLDKYSATSIPVYDRNIGPPSHGDRSMIVSAIVSFDRGVSAMKIGRLRNAPILSFPIDHRVALTPSNDENPPMHLHKLL